MASSEFVILRLNYVDRTNLFANPLRDDDDLARVISRATDQAFDKVSRRRKSGFSWSTRQSVGFTDEETHRSTIVFSLARSTLYREGSVVTPFGIESAVSESSPPLASTLTVVVDLKYHVFAVEYSSLIMQSNV